MKSFLQNQTVVVSTGLLKREYSKSIATSYSLDPQLLSQHGSLAAYARANPESSGFVITPEHYSYPTTKEGKEKGVTDGVLVKVETVKCTISNK